MTKCSECNHREDWQYSLKISPRCSPGGPGRPCCPGKPKKRKRWTGWDWCTRDWWFISLCPGAPTARGNRKPEHVEMQCPWSYRDARRGTPEWTMWRWNMSSSETPSTHGPARHADVFKGQMSAGQRWKKQEERMRERERDWGRREGKSKGGKDKGEELTFGPWLSSQPWRPWEAPLAFFSQGSCADHLNDRTRDHHGACRGWCYRWRS